ncbi:MAG: hypothetical protein Q9168_002600 [Polycauliona sp. 1 TL-2023]
MIAYCLGDSTSYTGLEFDETSGNASLDARGSHVNTEQEPEPPPNGTPSPIGNYKIFHCEELKSSAGFPELFVQVRQVIKLVLQDPKYGTASQHGYRTFFKSNEHLHIVQSVFEDIAAGRRVRGRPPTIHCLHPLGQAATPPSADSAICDPQQGHELVSARGWPASGSLILCPDFWTHPAFPNGTEDCPLVAGRRGFQKFAVEENGSALTDTQFGILIHELVRMYNPLDKELEEGGPSDIDGAKECFELDKEQSIQNAANWVLYAACKLLTTRLHFVSI